MDGFVPPARVAAAGGAGPLGLGGGDFRRHVPRIRDPFSGHRGLGLIEEHGGASDGVFVRSDGPVETGALGGRRLGGQSGDTQRHDERGVDCGCDDS
jgi:hypothetical protein